jgi:hypothetical protein
MEKIGHTRRKEDFWPHGVSSRPLELPSVAAASGCRRTKKEEDGDTSVERERARERKRERRERERKREIEREVLHQFK